MTLDCLFRIARVVYGSLFLFSGLLLLYLAIQDIVCKKTEEQNRGITLEGIILSLICFVFATLIFSIKG